MIKKPITEWIGDSLKGSPIITKKTFIEGLKDVFENEGSRLQLPGKTLVYEVELYQPVPEGTLGGLYFGITKIHPGKVDKEYFMTRGHFHAVSDRAEYYWGIKGEGLLLLMDRDRKVWAEKMYEGSLHYIPGNTFHRSINTGNELLSFGACWPSDAGHDYREIAINGFAVRVIEANGNPELVTLK
jgi:glucose-6-phosphate isomerase